MNSAAVMARWSQIIVTFTPPQLKTPAMILLTAWCYMKKKRGKKEPLRDFVAPSFFLHKASIKQMLKPWGTALGFPTMTIPQQDPGKHFRTTVPTDAVTWEDTAVPSPGMVTYKEQTSRYPRPSLASDYRRASQWQQGWTLLLLLSQTNMFTFCSVREILIQSQYLRQQERSN